jgi:hypothetical protein
MLNAENPLTWSGDHSPRLLDEDTFTMVELFAVEDAIEDELRRRPVESDRRN